MRGFICFSYLQRPVRCRITVSGPGPPGLRPAAPSGAISAKRHARAAS